MRAKMDVNIKGILDMFEEAAKTVKKGSDEVMEESIDELRAESLDEVPKDTGTLAFSSYQQIEKSADKVEGEVGYGLGGGINPKNKMQAHEYMITVHEDLYAYHPEGKAKFLEDPARRQGEKLKKKYGDRVKTDLEKIFRKG